MSSRRSSILRMGKPAFKMTSKVGGVVKMAGLIPEYTARDELASSEISAGGR